MIKFVLPLMLMRYYSVPRAKNISKKGLEAFVKNEEQKQDEALRKGPMAKFLFSLASLQKIVKIKIY